MIRRIGVTRGILRSRLGVAGLFIITAVILSALLAPLIAPYDPVEVKLKEKLQPPSQNHLMGTDQVGRDILSRVIWGARPSLQVGICSVFIGLIGGLILGILAGYYSGTLIEQVIMRIVDGWSSIPTLILAIAVLGLVGVGPIRIGAFSFPNEIKVILLVGFINIPPIARLAYSVALIESKSDYVRARLFQGASNWAIMINEVLRNCLSPIIVQATLSVGIGIIIEASLSFIGLGVQPPKPSWGNMLADARGYIFSGEWWLPVFPGLAISLTVIGINLLGDSLRDVLDPRKKIGSVMV